MSHDGSLPESPLTLLCVLLPDVYEVWANDCRVIICSVELWNRSVVVNFVLPLRPGAGEPQPLLALTDDVETRYVVADSGTSAQVSDGSVQYRISTVGGLHPAANAIHLPWSDGSELIVPLLV